MKKSKILCIITTILSMINLLCFYSIRPMWSGIILYAGHPAPYIIMGIILLIFLICIILCYFKAYLKILCIIFLIGDIFFLGLEGYIIALTTEAYVYFVRDFLQGLLVLLILWLLYYLFFQFSHTKLYQKKWFSPIIFILLFLAFILYHHKIVPNAITSTPVVYAVNHDYQIVFTSRMKGTGWVEIENRKYLDTYAGYQTSETTVHKITVPMEDLDQAGSYTIFTRGMLLRGPYCALQGKTYSKSYHWRGVNETDGLNYYVISDTHKDLSCPIKAASYFGEQLDFLICCGDVVSWIDETSDLTNILKLAGSITGGEVPVVYARGNHETKGIKAKDFYQYAASVNQKYYYTFHLHNVWGVVLDTGDDHADNYIEFSDLAEFNNYRTEQIGFLDDILANKDSEFDAPGIDYRILVCHIPITIKYEDDYAGDIKDEWLKRLNQMKLNICYSGHVHELLYVDDKIPASTALTLCPEYRGEHQADTVYYMNDADFPAILVSRKAKGQPLMEPETVLDTHFIGVAATANKTTTTLQYTNEKGEIVSPIISPWFSDVIYGDRIIIPNK